MAALLDCNSLPSYFLQGGLSMNTSNMHRALSAALTGLALAATTPFSYAARDVASETQITRPAEASQATPGPAMVAPRRAGRGAPLTLYLKDSSGNPFRLVHSEGTGWTYAAGWKSPSSGSAWLSRKVAFWSTSSARPAKDVRADDEPLTVFIDGPSGFTFVWDRESGWKFVGKLADKSR